MTKTRQGYLSYLLRLWFVRTETGWRWRASLENSRTGDSKRFDSLDQMSTYMVSEAEKTVGLEREVDAPGVDQQGGKDDE